MVFYLGQNTTTISLEAMLLLIYLIYDIKSMHIQKRKQLTTIADICVRILTITMFCILVYVMMMMMITKAGFKEGNVLFNDTLNTFYFTVIWCRTYGKGPLR